MDGAEARRERMRAVDRGRKIRPVKEKLDGMRGRLLLANWEHAVEPDLGASDAKMKGGMLRY